jgi:hypothetical protein
VPVNARTTRIAARLVVVALRGFAFACARHAKADVETVPVSANVVVTGTDGKR